MLFNEAFSSTSSVISLMSTASTFLAPVNEAAMESIPEPVPISKTVLSFSSNLFKISLRMSCVVSWRPVPKAPWDMKFILFFFGYYSSGEAITQVSSI